ncbi:methyltransferase domain-containing protein [Streptodolium elevatio]|uniref:Protein-L-isoaspartate O-methyltransferase n=1 Tax=Streptodolium elevatio TaxID=3157996 RepID=A0ABV3DVG6_9ACTN
MNDPISDEGALLRAQLTERLRAAGHARTSGVAESFREEPRHLYVPRFIRQHRTDDGGWQTEEVSEGHPHWLSEVYADQVLLTSTWPNMSSSTVPSLMADMLDALDVRPGMKVTEIGAGTGYNAGILGRLAGDENVLSVDVAPELVAAARASLASAGHGKVSVICADGGSAEPLRADSADRLIATCGVDDIPVGWLRAVRPGGRIVAPVGAGVAVLDVDEQHGAHGRFLATAAYFMGLRPADGSPLMVRPDAPDGPAKPCGMPLAAWEETRFTFLVSFALPSADVLTDTPADGGLVIWHRDGSIAHITGDGTA